MPRMGARLREERKRIGLTQDELATRACVVEKTIYNYETEASEMPLSFIALLGDLGADVEYLLFGRRVADEPAEEGMRLRQALELAQEYGKDSKGRLPPLDADTVASILWIWRSLQHNAAQVPQQHQADKRGQRKRAG